MNFTNQWHDLTGDLRLGARSLRRHAGFTATAMTSLALGVALTASTLSVMNSYVVRAMPFPKSERLYRALYDSPGQPEPRGLERIDWKSLGDVVEVADYSGLGRFLLHTGNYPEEISSLQCAPGSLDAIGVRAVIGRVFAAQDFRAGGEPVIMISNALWQERFGSSPGVLGKTVRVSAANSGETPTEYRIIGVLPAGFRFAGNYIRDPADTAMPLSAPRQAYMVRLRQGVPRALAEQRISDAVRSAASAIPVGWRGVRLESVHAHYVRAIRPVLVGLTVASGLVLLIVVTNILVLMLLRALRRQKETAVRVVLGAEPHRIARLLLGEAVWICGIALAAGFALTAITLRALGPQIEARLGRPVPGGLSALAMDGTVLLWMGGIGLLITLAAAWLPMIGARPARLADSLRAEGRSGTDRSTVRRTRTFLVALEVAASTALLIAGGLMLRSAGRLIGTNLGYETNHVFRPRLQLPISKYRDGDIASFARFYDRLEQRLAGIPNLSFALSTFVPFWEPPKQPLETDLGANPDLRASITAAGPDYFQTLGIGLREGRTFTPGDRQGAEAVAVISESLARLLAPRGSALGTTIVTTEAVPGQRPRVRRTVVGVVHDVHQTHADVDLKDVYIPFAQTTTRFASVYIRGSGSSKQWLETLRIVVAAIDADVFVGPAPPLSMQSDEMLAGPRFITAILMGFALFAALLALLGIYGVTAYAVQQREREIAIRMAIGATPGAVIRMFLRNSGKVLVVGIAGGLFGAGAVSRILQSQLHGVERFDPWAVAGVCVFLVTAGLFATWLPALRAARSDPMTALRAE
ncbi:MAG TPA: ABC transporter permease [Bryobacteraceae bacterium]|nr:ABC transporter permease [Bryobacteraceae bacterium]